MLLYGNWELYFCTIFGWCVTRNHRNTDISTAIVWIGMGQHGFLGDDFDGRTSERDVLGNGLDGDRSCDLSR